MPLRHATVTSSGTCHCYPGWLNFPVYSSLLLNLRYLYHAIKENTASRWRPSRGWWRQKRMINMTFSVMSMILFWRHHPLLGRHLLAIGREWSWISSEEVHCPVCTKLSNVSQYLVLKNELYLFIYLKTWWISIRISERIMDKKL